jgi:DNA-binding transcriptional regulator YiaG
MSTKKKIQLNKENFGSLLIDSMQEALDHAKGKISLDSVSLSLPADPPKYSKTKIKKIRVGLLEVSQPIFATILGVSPSAVKSWEQGNNSPNGAIRRLLQVIENDPASFLQAISKDEKKTA